MLLLSQHFFPLLSTLRDTAHLPCAKAPAPAPEAMGERGRGRHHERRHVQRRRLLERQRQGGPQPPCLFIARATPRGAIAEGHVRLLPPARGAGSARRREGECSPGWRGRGRVWTAPAEVSSSSARSARGDPGLPGVLGREEHVLPCQASRPDVGSAEPCSRPLQPNWRGRKPAQREGQAAHAGAPILSIFHKIFSSLPSSV